MQQVNGTNPWVWKNVSLDKGKKYQLIVRDGKYACMWVDNYSGSHTTKIIDLNTMNCLATFKCQMKEWIKAFHYPYVVTLLDRKLRIWDTSICQLKKTINLKKLIPHQFHYIKVHRVAMQNKTIGILSYDCNFRNPRFITVIKDFESADSTTINKIDKAMDEEAGLLIKGDEIFYSTWFGKLRIVSSPGLDQYRTIPTEPEFSVYVSHVSKETIPKYVENSVNSLVIDGNIVIGSSKNAIKIWDTTANILQKEIPTEDEYHLQSLEGRFLLGFNSDNIQIWDIFSGTVLHKEKNTSSELIPRLILYKNNIFRVYTGENEYPDITVELPVIEEKEEPSRSVPGDFQKEPSEQPKERSCIFL